MGSIYGQKFDKAIRDLRKKVPLPVSAKVKTRKNLMCQETGDALYGQCTAHVNSRGRVKRFTIEISRDLPLDVAVDTLLHEWAHAIDQIENGADDDAHPHRDSWGVAYAKIWRAYMDED